MYLIYFLLQPTEAYDCIAVFICTIVLYSMICSPSDHTVGRPLYRFDHGMGGLEAGTTLTTRPPHLLHNILRELNVPGIELSLRQNVGLYPIHTLINISILIISNFRLKITLRDIRYFLPMGLEVYQGL